MLSLSLGKSLLNFDTALKFPFSQTCLAILNLHKQLVYLMPRFYYYRRYLVTFLKLLLIFLLIHHFYLCLIRIKLSNLHHTFCFIFNRLKVFKQWYTYDTNTPFERNTNKMYLLANSKKKKKKKEGKKLTTFEGNHSNFR